MLDAYTLMVPSELQEGVYISVTCNSNKSGSFEIKLGTYREMTCTGIIMDVVDPQTQEQISLSIENKNIMGIHIIQ